MTDIDDKTIGRVASALKTSITAIRQERTENFQLRMQVSALKTDRDMWRSCVVMMVALSTLDSFGRIMGWWI